MPSGPVALRTSSTSSHSQASSGSPGRFLPPQPRSPSTGLRGSQGPPSVLKAVPKGGRACLGLVCVPICERADRPYPAPDQCYLSFSFCCSHLLKRPFCSPSQCWPASTLIELGTHGLSPFGGKRRLSSPLVSPVLPSSVPTVSFSASVPDEDLCSDRLAFCPARLASDTLELPAPALVRGGSQRATSTPGHP